MARGATFIRLPPCFGDCAGLPTVAHPFLHDDGRVETDPHVQVRHHFLAALDLPPVHDHIEEPVELAPLAVPCAVKQVAEGRSRSANLEAVLKDLFNGVKVAWETG